MPATSLSSNVAELVLAQYTKRCEVADPIRFMVGEAVIETCPEWIASLHSPVLGAMLTSQMSEARTRAIQIREEDRHIWPSLVKFFYGVSIDFVDFDHAIHLLRCAEFYDIAEVRDQSSLWLGCCELSAAQALQIIKDAPFDGFLEARAWTLLENRPAELFSSDAWLSCDEQTVCLVLGRNLGCGEKCVFDAALQWSRNSVALTNTAGDAMSHDRGVCPDEGGGAAHKQAAVAVDDKTKSSVDWLGMADVGGSSGDRLWAVARAQVASMADRRLDRKGASDGCGQSTGTSIQSEKATRKQFVLDAPLESEMAVVRAQAPLESSLHDQSTGTSIQSEYIIMCKSNGAPPCLIDDFLQDKFLMNQTVVALEDIKCDSAVQSTIPKGSVGQVVEIDPEGDAQIRFEDPVGETCWLFREKLCKFGCGLPLSTITAAIEAPGTSFEELRWQDYSCMRQEQKQQEQLLPLKLRDMVRFEYMTIQELLACKAYLPVEEYVAFLEVASNAKPFATRFPRDKPAAARFGTRRCTHCGSDEASGGDCSLYHPSPIVETTYEIRDYRCNHKGRCSTCLSCSEGLVQMTRSRQVYGCCKRLPFSEGCAARGHNWEMVYRVDELSLLMPGDAWCSSELVL